MFIMKVISQFARTPHIHKDYLKGKFFNSEASAFRLTEKLKIIQANNSAISSRCYSDKPFVSRIKDTSEEGKKQKESEKKKRDFIPKITLLDQNGNITVTTMQEASKLAQRRNLKLIYLRNDPKSNRSEYKLVSTADYLKSKLQTTELEVGLGEKQKGATIKKEKLAQISSKIAEHDLQAKLKQIHKWIDKRHEVRVAINIDTADSSMAENLYKLFEKEFKSIGRLHQKIVKHDSLKFVILPPKVKDESSKRKKENKDSTETNTEQDTAES